MPAPAQRRLAGFRFDVQSPVLPDKLPRMDIAVFVGFAAAGPLDCPVAIEDPARYQELFGDDLPLAWDTRRGRRVQAHLGPAVRAFFRNGGRRCWVIRVARRPRPGAPATETEGLPETNWFPLPGMLELDGTALRAAFARARSPGSFFDPFSCATALSVTPIALDANPGPSFKELIVRLRTGMELQAGDLLRVRCLDSRIHAFLAVEGIQPADASPLSSRSSRFSVQSRLLHCFEEADSISLSQIPCTVIWTLLPAHDGRPATIVTRTGSFCESSSPPNSADSGLLELQVPDLSSGDEETFSPPAGTLLQIETLEPVKRAFWFRVARIGHDETGQGSPPARGIRIHGHAFRICDEPAFLPPNARFVLEQLAFELHVRRGETAALRLSELGFAWRHPRYWNALPDDQTLFDSEDISPGASRDWDHAMLLQDAAEHPSSTARFPLAGTGKATPIFLPLLVQALPDEFLPAQHSRTDELSRDGLKDFQSNLFLDEALVGSTSSTLMNDADFIRYQRPDPRRLRGIHAAFEIEEATLIAVPDAVHAGWDLSEIERPLAPEASAPLPHPCWGLSDKCDDPPEPITGTQPRRDKFLNCGLRVIQPPELDTPSDPVGAGTFTLIWSQDADDLIFVLEEATRPDFSDAREIYRGDKSQRTLFGRPAGNYYYRVRAEAGCETSNWSKEILVPVRTRARYELRPIGEFLPETAIDVHRSLLRMCAARGDLFAVLALPGHFRSESALSYLRWLRPPENGRPLVIGGTPPLGPGESSVFSFGAIYHPWLITRDGADEPGQSPPDGAVVGLMARRSMERGAWIAPANQSLRDVIALTPALPDGRRLDLLLAQINQITQEPEGFLALNADTLSLDSELRPINVRRLLIFLRRAALKRGADYVFEPHGPALRRLVQHAFEELLNQLFVRGAFAGETRATSYEVVTDDTINTPQGMELGRFRVDLKVAPSRPMSFVTVRLIQTGERGVATELV